MHPGMLGQMQKETPTSLGNLVANPAERDPKPCLPRQSEAATGRLHFIEYQALLRQTLLTNMRIPEPSQYVTVTLVQNFDFSYSPSRYYTTNPRSGMRLGG